MCELLGDEFPGAKPDPHKDVLEHQSDWVEWVQEENENTTGDVDLTVTVIELEKEYMLNNLKKEESKITYYLFGDDAVTEYEDACYDDNQTPIEAVVTAIEDDNLSYGAYAHNEADNSVGAISEYDGWRKYILLTKEEYDKL